MVMGSSNLMMGLTLVLVVCLAIVLGLVLVLLAELYCSILLRRRHTTTAAADQETTTTGPPPNLPNLYTQSILTAPRNLLYPTLAGAGGLAGGDIEKQNPPENQENLENDQDFMYISNPMYDGDVEINGRKSRVAGNTPFETPDTSPSRLETEETSSGEDSDGGGGGGGKGGEEVTSVKVVVVTPPLTPMKKLPEAVDDGGAGGGEDSNNGVSSSSSSGTPCTSLSW